MNTSVSKLADTLVSQSAMYNCSFEEAWENHMHPFLTKQATFEEVKQYIDDKIYLGINVERKYGLEKRMKNGR